MRLRRVLVPSAALAALLLAGREARRGSNRSVGPTRGRFARARRLALLGGRGATRKAVLRLRKLNASPERRSDLDEQFAIRTAEDVAEHLGQMRGVLMKVGQMASVMIDTLPDSARAALASLQESAPPMSPTLAAEVIASDLGAPPQRLFREWEPIPIAAASIGQVHRAVTTDGDEVAVKVQYPGVADAIEADLGNTRLISAMLGRWFQGLDPDEIVGELRSRFNEELDYRIEFANQAEFADIYAGHPWVRIPAPVSSLSGTRVLTSEWMNGQRFEDFRRDGSSEAHNRAGEVIWRFMQHAIHRHHVFNGDPHPGNYRFHRDGTVAFLDFGLVRRWSPSEWAELQHTLYAVVVDRDPEAIVAAMRRSGFIVGDQPVDVAAVTDYVCAPYEPYLVDHFQFTPEWMSGTLARIASPTGDNVALTRTLRIPPSFILLNRVVWGINALLSQLEVSGPFRAMVLEYLVGAPPATEVGEAEQSWLRRREAATGSNGSDRLDRDLEH